jgi:hypothetical protein
MPRRIYLMTDYESSSLWTDEPEHSMVGLGGLPLSSATKRALEVWSAREWDFLAGEESGDPMTEEYEAHDREGLRLWSVVRQELGSDFEVGYAVFDPDPGDVLGASKRVVWDPADL